MNDIRELLRDADPLRHEPPRSSEERDSRREVILNAARGTEVRGPSRSRQRVIALAAVGLMAIVASLFGVRVWSLFVGDLEAAVRFEIRLAEDRPAVGLTEAKDADSGRRVYLHGDVIVSNADIVATRVVAGGDSMHYSVGVEFNASGTEKMRAATREHVGRPIAILLDGQVVLAPTLRSEIGSSARITGKFTKDQAERIANGIRIRSGR